MNNNPAIPKITGVLWLLMVAMVFTAIVIVIKYNIALNPSELGSGAAGETLRGISNNATAHITELVFDLLSDVVLIAIAALMYIIFSGINRAAALVGTMFLASGGVVLSVHDMGNFALTWVAWDYVNSTEAKAIALEASASAMLLTAKWGVAIGSLFVVLGIFVYGTIVRNVSNIIGWFGILGSFLGLIAIPMGWIGPEWEAVSMNLFMPMLLWQITFGVWLIKNAGKLSHSES